MKRPIIAVFLVIFTVLISFIGQICVRNVATGVTKTVEECQNLYLSGDKNSAQELALKIEKKWDKQAELLSLFINHNSIHEIGVSIAKLPPLIKSGSNDNLLTECKVIEVLLRNQKEELRIKLESIF